MIDLQEQRWIRAAQKGDADAFEALVQRYESMVLRITRRTCHDPEDAEDAAQEAFLAAWRGLSQFRGEASFSTWLYRLAANACVDVLRRRGRHQGAFSLDDEEAAPEIPDDAPTPEEAAEQSELRDQIRAGLNALPPERREVLLLREVEQLSYEEIAARTGLDLGTVKSRINRGRRQLVEILQKSGNFSARLPSKQTEKEGCK